MGQWKRSILDVDRFGWPAVYDRYEKCRSLEGLRGLRRELQRKGEDFNVSDFFDAHTRFRAEGGHDRYVSPVTLCRDASFARAALDLMHEMGKTVSVRKFTKEHKVRGKDHPGVSLMLDLASKDNSPGAIQDFFSSPYWNDHPEDMVPAWNGLPENYRAKNPMPAFIEYADRPTLADMRHPRGWIRKLSDSERTPAHIEGLGIYKSVKDGNADYLFERLDKNGEKLALSDYLLGSKAGIATVLDMLVEQGHLPRIMDAKNWNEGEEAAGRLMIGISVPPEMLKAQTGLSRDDLLAEFRACPWGDKLEAELQKMVEASSIHYASAQIEQGNEPHVQADHEPNHFSAAIDELEWPAHLVARGDQLLIEKLQRELAEANARLAEKPTTIVRDPTPAERLADMSEILRLNGASGRK